MKLYFDHSSEPSTAVYLFLKYNNIDFEPHIIDLFQAENKTPDYEKVTPFQRVPVLDDDGFILTESVAILRYLASKYNTAEHWFPKQDIRKQARFDEFLNWYHTNMRKSCIELLLTKVFMRMAFDKFPKIPYDAEKLKVLEGNQEKMLKDFDAYFLNGKAFIVGEEISAADLMAFCELRAQEICEDDPWGSYINVKSWMKRVEAKLGKAMETSNAFVKDLREGYVNAKE